MRLSALRSALSILEKVTALAPLDAADRKIINAIRGKFLEDSKDDRDLTRDELIILYRDIQTASPDLKSLADKVKQAFNSKILSSNSFLMDDLDAFLKLPEWKQKNVIQLANYLSDIELLPNKPLGPVFQLLKPILFTNPIQLKEAIHELFNHRELNRDNPQRTLQLGKLLSTDNVILIAKTPEDAAIIAKSLCVLHKKELLEDNRAKLLATPNLNLVATAVTQLPPEMTQATLDQLFEEAAKESCTAMTFHFLTARLAKGNPYRDYKSGGTRGLLAPFSIHHGIPPTEEGAVAAAPMSDAAIAKTTLIPEDQAGDFCSKLSALICRRK